MVADRSAGAQRRRSAPSLAALWPREYISEAQIGIAAPTLSPELLRGVSSLDKEERQRAISQQLLSREVLERVVREEKLNPDKPVEDVAGWLRSRWRRTSRFPTRSARTRTDTRHRQLQLGYTTPIPTARSGSPTGSPTCSSRRTPRPRRTRRRTRRKCSASSCRRRQERLTQLEDAAAVEEGSQHGPASRSDQRQRRDGQRACASQLESLSVQLRSEQDRLSVIDSQIEDDAPGQCRGADVDGRDRHPGAAGAHRALQQQLTQERALGKTDKHPDVIALQDEIANARAPSWTASSSRPAPAATNCSQADPMYQQRVQDRDCRAAADQHAAARSRRRRSAQIGAVSEPRRRGADGRAGSGVRCSATSSSSSERYEDLKTQLRERAVGRGPRAQAGRRALQRALPRLPRAARPTRFSRSSCCSWPSALGFMLGAALVVGREFLDRSVHDARALQNEFEIPVLGEIPRIHGAA